MEGEGAGEIVKDGGALTRLWRWWRDCGGWERWQDHECLECKGELRQDCEHSECREGSGEIVKDGGTGKIVEGEGTGEIVWDEAAGKIASAQNAGESSGEIAKGEGASKIA